MLQASLLKHLRELQTADVSADEGGCYKFAIVEWMVDIAIGIDAGVIVSGFETKLQNLAKLRLQACKELGLIFFKYVPQCIFFLAYQNQSLPLG